MSEHRKLTAGELHIMRLIRKESGADGWTPVSYVVARAFMGERSPSGPMPAALCEFEATPGGDGSGRARLTMEGKALLDSLAWL
jgi:hypothetical protein